MSIGAILTLGYGSFSDVNHVVTLGYGSSAVSPTPPPFSIPGGKGDSGREDEELRKALAYQAEQRMRIRDEQDAMDALDFMMTFLQGERDASS